MDESNILKTAIHQGVVRIQMSSGAIIGTGILVSPTNVLTCDHVLDGVGDIHREPVLQCVFLERANDVRRVTEIRRLPATGAGHRLECDHRRDVAVLVVEAPFTITPTPLLWSEPTPAGSTRVAFAGFRQDVAGGALECSQTMRGDFDATRGCYMLQDPSAVGFSGGPVVHASVGGPRAVGMVVANLREFPQRGWFLPTRAIEGVLRQLGESELPRSSSRSGGDILGGMAAYQGYLESLRIKHGLDRSFIDLSAKVLLPRHEHVSSLTDRIVEQISASRQKQLRMFVLGHYGTGKSSVAVEATIRALSSYLDAPGRLAKLPIYLRLWDWRTLPSWAEVKDYLSNSPNYPFLDVERVERYASQNRLFFLLDGLDEMSGRLSWRDSIAVVNGIPRSLYPGASYVAFSRLSFFLEHEQMLEVFDTDTYLLPADLTQRLRDLQYQVLSLDPPSEGQIRRYLDDTCGTEAEHIVRLLEETYNLADLARRPVLLKMTIDCLPLLLSGIDVDDRIEAADLYEMYVQQWLLKTQYAVRVSLKKRLWILEELALTIWDRNPPRITSLELSKFLERKVKECQVDELLFDIANCSLLDLGEEGYEFSHKSFLEYFTARAVVRYLFRGGRSRQDTPPLISKVLRDAPSHNEVMDFVQTLVLRRLSGDRTGLTQLLATLESSFPQDRQTVAHLLGHVAKKDPDPTLGDKLVKAYQAEEDVLAQRTLAIACGRAGRSQVMADYVRDVLPKQEPRYQNLLYHLEYYGSIRQTLVALISHLLSPRYLFLRELDLFTLRQIINCEQPMSKRQQAFARAVLTNLREATTDEDLFEYVKVGGREFQTQIATRRESP